MRRRPALLSLLALAVLIAVFHHAIAMGIVASALSWATKTNVSFSTMQLSTSGATFTGLAVRSRSGEPIARIARLRVRYDLHEFLFGGGRQYGLRSISIDRPRLTVIRNRNGTFNIPIPKLAKGKPGGPPLVFTGAVREGSATFVDAARAGPNMQPIAIERANATFDVDTAARTTYAIAASYVAQGRLYPLHGRGLIDASHPFEMQHVWAPRLPIASLLNDAVGSSALHVNSASLAGLDVRVFGIAPQGGTMHPHVAGSVRLENGNVRLAALTQPITGLHGTLDITESAITTTGLRGTLGGIAANLKGGVYDLRHPQARFSLDTRASLSQFRPLVHAAAHLPNVSGLVALHVLVEGAALKPAALVAIDSSRILYNGVALAHTSALINASAPGVDIVGARTTYGNVTLAATGSVRFARAPGALQLLFTGAAPATSLPFVSGIVPGMTLHATALATATDLRRIHLSGFVAGRTSTQRASSLFAVSSLGVGTVGPLVVGNAQHWLYARIALDHPHASIVALAQAHRFHIAPAPRVPLGNFRVSQIPLVAGSIDGVVIGAQRRGNVVVRVRNGAFTAKNGTPWVSALDATIAMRGGSLDVSPASARIFGGEAQIAGHVAAGRGALTFLLAGARFGGLALSGAGSLGLSGSTAHVEDVLLNAGGSVLTGQGNVALTGSHRYSIDGRLRNLDLQRAAAIAYPKLASNVAGIADARFHIAGTGASPSVAGDIAVAQGSFDGEGFRALQFHVAGSRSDIALDNGSVAVGTSRIGFHGSVAAGGASSLALSAPHVNLADFNDFFNAGDMLAGHGRLQIALATGSALSTSGSAHLAGARLRQYDLGTANARWSTIGSSIHLVANATSPTGRFRIAGNVAPPPLALLSQGAPALLRSTALDLSLRARNVALASWAPPLSLNAPLTGTANASATVRGRYPTLAVAASASVDRAMAGRVPIESLRFSGTMRGNRGTIRSLTLQMPYLNAAASGSFGLARTAPFALHASATSPNVGLLATTATGERSALGGALRASATLRGTLANPHVAASFALRSARFARFVVPRVRGEVVASRASVALRNGEADLVHGRLLASGHIPLRVRGRSIAGAPLFARVTAQSVALANFASLMPQGTVLGGTIGGSLAVLGTTTNPRLRGSMRLANGSYNGPLDKAPLDRVTGVVAFAGRTIHLQSLRARAGSGTLAGSGTVVVPNVLNPGDATVALTLDATHATVDSPQYFSGQVDAHVATAYARGRPISLRGRVAVSHATIPVSALYHSGAKGPSPKLPAVAFHLRIAASGVRVKNSVVDVGGAGNALLTGTLSAPVMAGVFHSTGGTLNFYQLFRIARASIAFTPSNGLTPYVNAVATTIVAQPPTTVHIHVTGPATGMHLALSSSPSYDRSQILGLLVGMQTFGAVQGIPAPTASPFSASSVVRSVGFGEANHIFTQSILAPIATTLGGALGTQNLQIYSNIGSGYGTGIGASIVKRIAQHITITTSANFGYPWQELVKLRYVRPNATEVVMSLYNQQQSFLNSVPPLMHQSPDNLGLRPSSQMIDSASSGIVLSFERRYWSCGLFHYCLSCSRC